MLFCELIGNKLDYTHIHFNDFWKLWEKKKKKAQKEEMTHPFSHPLLQKKPYLYQLYFSPYLLP